MVSIKFRGLQKISAETIAMLDPVFLLRSVGKKLLSKSRMSSTSSPELESIKVTWVSGISAVLRMPAKKGRVHFPLERKMQSYGHLPLE